MGDHLNLLVVGSIAYDTVESPTGRAEGKLGGSATYFSAAASYFTDVGVVAAVGSDFAAEDRALFKAWGVDTGGMETIQGRTFRWSGLYEEDLNSAVTRETQLNVFAGFDPHLGPSQKSAPYLFLANIDPGLQRAVLGQMDPRPRLVACDTMNLWIDTSRPRLTGVIRDVDALLINEGEVRLLTGERGIVAGAETLLNMGPRTLVVKRGEHGAAIFDRGFTFALPAYLVAAVADPTGAGDSFAGGFMGYLAATGQADEEALRCAAVVGSVMASFAVESFGLDRLCSLTAEDIEQRFAAFANLTRFDPLGAGRGLPLMERGR